MSRAIERLLEISSPPLSRGCSALPEGLVRETGPLGRQLRELLERKNGFYAFESALHVFPARSTPSEIGLEAWNAADCWRSCYEGMADGCLFFAEDVFGCQFSLKPDGVYRFDPETGEQSLLASDMDGWAEALLADYPLLTGHRFAHEWQLAHGAIPPGKRLLPKRPFVVGGDFALDNLYLLEAIRGMQLRGGIATQIRDLPDGTEIRIQVVD